MDKISLSMDIFWDRMTEMMEIALLEMSTIRDDPFIFAYVLNEWSHQGKPVDDFWKMYQHLSLPTLQGKKLEEAFLGPDIYSEAFLEK